MTLERELPGTVAGRAGASAPGGEVVRTLRAAGLDRALAVITEVPAAILVALEIVVLFAGVVSRYVFHAPLTWSDELASILFLWLAMLGAVIALRRGEHMRLTAIASRVPARWRALLETVAALVVVAFVMLVLLPAHRYVLDEWAILTPALEIHNSFRAAAIEVGIRADDGDRARPAGRAREPRPDAGGARASPRQRRRRYGWRGRRCWALGNYNLIVFFVGLVALCVAIGVPIAFAFGVATLSYLALVTHVPLHRGHEPHGRGHVASASCSPCRSSSSSAC